MPDPFTLSQSLCAAAGDALRQDIHSHTANDEATDGILRSISRFGSDSTILRYEISPKAQSRSHKSAKSVAWTVRAIRRTVDPPPHS